MTNELIVTFKTNQAAAERVKIGFGLAQAVSVGLRCSNDAINIIHTRGIENECDFDHALNAYLEEKPKLELGDFNLSIVVQTKSAAVRANIANPEFRAGYEAGIRNTRIALQLGHTRVARGMSVLQLCKLSKVPQKVINAIEAGDIDDVQFTHLISIAKALDIALEVGIVSHADFVDEPPDLIVPSFEDEAKEMQTHLQQEKTNGKKRKAPR